MSLKFPKPKDTKAAPQPIRFFKDGREVCNLLTKGGRDIYMNRIREMVERQGGFCCLKGLVKGCPGKLALKDATYDHGEGRGAGGGHRDDRIWIPDPATGGLKAINGAAHAQCNALKGSVRMSKLLNDAEAVDKLFPDFSEVP